MRPLKLGERDNGTSSEYVRELIRADQDRRYLHKLLAGGASSPVTAPIDEAYFLELRARARQAE